MATMEQHVETQLSVIDKATGPLSKVAEHAEKAAHGLEHATHAAQGSAHGAHEAHGAFGALSHVLSDLAGVGLIVGAGLSLHSAVESTEKYMKSIKHVHELTGATAEETDFMFSSARRAGVEYETMERTMAQLSRKGSMMELTTAAAANHVPGMAKKFAALGITVDKGPVKAIETMASAVKKGKLHAGDLMSQFRIPPAQVNEVEEFLKHLDPKKLAAARAGKGGFVSGEDLEGFIAMEEAQHRISDTWNRMKTTVINKLFPIAASMAGKLADRLESALPKIQEAMQYVVDHMDDIVAAAKVFAAVMTSKKMFSLVAQINSKEGFLGKLAAHGLSSLVGGGTAAAEGATVVGPLAQLGPYLAALAIPLLGLVAVLAVAAFAVYGFMNNIGGARDALVELWDSFAAKLELIGDAIGNLFGATDGLSGMLTTATNAATAFTLAIFQVVDGALEMFVLTGYVISETATQASAFFSLFVNGLKSAVYSPMLMMLNAVSEAINSMLRGNFAQAAAYAKGAMVLAGDMGAGWNTAGKDALKVFDGGILERAVSKSQKDINARVAAREQDRVHGEHAEKHKPEDGKPPGTVNDFRGSKFDITQNFAEGFDPDRIAVAFSSDLAQIGEMRSQSGFAPTMSGV